MKRRGTVMFGLLAILFAVFLLALGLSVAGINSMRMTAHRRGNVKAFDTAEAGLRFLCSLR